MRKTNFKILEIYELTWLAQKILLIDFIHPSFIKSLQKSLRRMFMKKNKMTAIVRMTTVIALITGIGLAKQSLAQGNPTDYTSKVPKYTFANTLEEQEAQLKTNPLLLRFAESRKKMKGDRYRPIYHYVSPESTMNDPNGLCFWRGNWHMFYQAYPPEDKRQHWGHAISKDLIHWTDLPYAIYPSPERAVVPGARWLKITVLLPCTMEQRLEIWLPCQTTHCF